MTCIKKIIYKGEVMKEVYIAYGENNEVLYVGQGTDANKRFI